MSDFVQTMKYWKRMCNAMGQEDEYTACDKCDLRDYGCPAIYEKECDSADWNHVEKVVAKWAAEHPEPVYPTWWSWLINEGVIEKGSTYTGAFDQLKTKSIPAGIAQKLGIEPKEVK
jgi:hypothetical protein